MPALPGGSGMILNFASKLHSFGVDKLQLGHGDIFNGVATNDLTGDAIKASLLEGKSVAKMAAVGKTAPTVSDTNAALATANANNIDSLINDYDAARANFKTAKDNVAMTKSQFTAIDAQYRSNPDDQGLRAQWLAAKTAYQNDFTALTSAVDALDTTRNKMIDAAQSAGSDAITKATAAIQKYLA
jgi:outer membrane murein-binding lipoprotein Lpp